MKLRWFIPISLLIPLGLSATDATVGGHASQYTFSDGERAVQREIVNRNYLARYELRLVEEQQATDLALLRQLESKYRTPVGERDQEPQLAAPPVDQTPVTPVQGSLFQSRLELQLSAFRVI